MRGLRSHLTYANVMATIAIFLGLGGTAVAIDGSLAGQNTVGSADIINGEVKTDDIRDGNVTLADLHADSVNSTKVLNDSLTPTDIADLALLRANTVRLNDQPGGSGVTQTLFTIGQVTLRATCSATSTDLVAHITANTAAVGPVLVTDGEAGDPDFVTPLNPFSVDFLMLVNAAESAEETSFAILDNDNTTASGVAAASVDPDTGDCVISAQAVG